MYEKLKEEMQTYILSLFDQQREFRDEYHRPSVYPCPEEFLVVNNVNTIETVMAITDSEEKQSESDDVPFSPILIRNNSQKSVESLDSPAISKIYRELQMTEMVEQQENDTGYALVTAKKI